MPETKSILILGGGVIGLCTAYYAMQKGHRVTILERGAPEHDCCSLGNAGLIVPSHVVPLAAPGMVAQGLRMMLNPESPFWIRPRLDRELLTWGWKFMRAANARHVSRAAPLLCDLHLASRRCYEELDEQLEGGFGLVKNGLLMLCETERGLKEEIEAAKMARDLGLSAEVLAPEETTRLEPNMTMDIAGAVYYAQDCHLTPSRFLAELTRALKAGGVQFEWSAETTGWRAGDRRIEAFETTRGEFTADEYVLACGSWSAKLVKSLGLRLPLQAGKGYNLTLSAPRQMPAVPCLLTEARVAVTPMGSSLRFAGTLEFTGLDQIVNPRRVNGIIRSIPRYLPAFQPEELRSAPVWSGLRPCSPDGLPYVGRFGRYRNLSAATGHAMMGLSLGPITGRLMAEILSDEHPSLPIEALSPDRYLKDEG
jgi:D-amino-acid dehydrogenase